MTCSRCLPRLALVALSSRKADAAAENSQTARGFFLTGLPVPLKNGRNVMAASQEQELTNLLKAWSEGDQQAFEKLVPQVQKELRRLASRYMAGERPNHALQTTALI